MNSIDHESHRICPSYQGHLTSSGVCPSRCNHIDTLWATAGARGQKVGERGGNVAASPERKGWTYSSGPLLRGDNASFWALRHSRVVHQISRNTSKITDLITVPFSAVEGFPFLKKSAVRLSRTCSACLAACKPLVHRPTMRWLVCSP